MWPPWRSTYSNAIATIRTGKEPTTISTLASAVHVNTGIRRSDIPGARRLATVTSTQAAIAVLPAAARITPTTHRSCPTPGAFVPLDSGVYGHQPARTAPSVVSQPDRLTNHPHSQVQ